jgi:hypothetical protein
MGRRVAANCSRGRGAEQCASLSYPRRPQRRVMCHATLPVHTLRTAPPLLRLKLRTCGAQEHGSRRAAAGRAPLASMEALWLRRPGQPLPDAPGNDCGYETPAALLCRRCSIAWLPLPEVRADQHADRSRRAHGCNCIRVRPGLLGAQQQLRHAHGPSVCRCERDTWIQTCLDAPRAAVFGSDACPQRCPPFRTHHSHHQGTLQPRHRRQDTARKELLRTHQGASRAPPPKRSCTQLCAWTAILPCHDASVAACAAGSWPRPCGRSGQATSGGDNAPCTRHPSVITPPPHRPPPPRLPRPRGAGTRCSLLKGCS